MPHVCFTHPESGTRRVELGEKALVIGRAGGGADVELDADRRVSRRHGRVWLQDGEVWYQDLGSSNGSFQEGTRLSGPVRLLLPVRLGETTLSLDDGGTDQLPRAEGMMLQKHGGAGAEDAARAMSEARSARYTAALYEFVQALLRSTSRDLIARAVEVIQGVVPAAQRVLLVEWPPGDGALAPLVPGASAEGVSVSLARYAVEHGQALLLSDALEAGAPGVEMSAVRLGMRSAVYVPMVTAESEVMGVLCVDTPRPGLPFGDEDFQFIRAVGGLLATALASERSRDEARQREVEARGVAARREAMMAFLSIASHDLRSPLTVIMLGAEVMRRRPDPSRVEELLDTMVAACRRAQGLVHTYLEVAALDAGKTLSVSREDVDVARMLREEMELAQAALEGRASAYRFSSDIAVETVSADPQKLRQILGNLLSNAIKYSPRGGAVEVSVSRVGDDVVFAVRDEGVGISPSDQQRLFQQFQRVGDNVAKGAGLGLWLTAALVSAHGGRIRVDSEPGRGSTFSFTLPEQEGGRP